MTDPNEKLAPSSSDMMNEAVNEVMAESPGAASNVESFVAKVSEKFIEKKLDNFPKLCAEARRVNFLKQKQLAEIGNPGGWSDKKDFKFDYEIPRELYLFMQNLVYKDFWAEENEKIWRKFMRGVLQGEPAINLLMMVKQEFGSNKDVSLIS